MQKKSAAALKRCLHLLNIQLNNGIGDKDEEIFKIAD